MNANEFQTRIDALDLTLFDAIESGTNEGDRRSLLGLHKAVRDLYGEYVYLEIGSHIGGSLQTHLLDPKCRKIYSIDSRPEKQPDQRGVAFPYPGNSTDRMMHVLQDLAPENVEKVICFDRDAAQIDPTRIEKPPQLCFIDGEHTDRAVISDFEFCRAVASPNAIIAFHDAPIVRGGLESILNGLDGEGIEFTAGHLEGVIFVIALGNSGIVSQKGPPANAPAEPASPQGWMLEPDRDALGQQMRTVFEDPQTAKEKGMRASAYVRENLTWEKSAEMVMDRLVTLKRKPIVRERPSSAKVPPSSEPSVALIVLGEGRGEDLEQRLKKFSGLPYQMVDSPAGVTPAALVNQVLRQVTCEFLAILRPDIVPTRDWLCQLVSHMRDPSVAMIGPALPEGPEGQRTAAQYRSVKKELQKFARRYHRRGKGSSEQVEFLSPACVLIRREALLRVGGLDEAFRTAAWIDDFARKCRQTELQVFCARDTYVHSEGACVSDAEIAERQAVEALERGDRHRKAGEADASMACYRKALDAKEDYLEATLILSTCLLESDRGREAAELFGTLEEKHPDSSRIKNYLGRCLYQAGDVEAARNRLQRSIEMDPDFSEPYNNLGVLLWENGELDSALENLKKAAELAPSDPNVIYNIAMVYAQLGQPKQAMEMLNLYVQSCPDDLHARVHLAALLLENEQEAEGLSQLEEVLSIDPEHSEALKVVAQLQEAVSDPDDDQQDARACGS